MDATFIQDDTGVGPVRHEAFKEEMPGRVDLWPMVEKDADTEESPAWYDPIDRVSAQDPKVVLAGAIAGHIRAMIDRSETVPAEIGTTGVYERRPIHEGDILILVQGRGGGAAVSLFSEIIGACKKAGLKVAGADRLKVGAELAVRDIAALLRFLALAEDDLSLACALRSPLFGLSEDDIYRLAQPRGDAFLWQAFRATDQHPEARAIIDDLRQQADYLRPYDLINRILTRHDGRVRLLARLGPEAEDGIDALLSQALGYERSEVPGLTGFLEWMETDALEIKRQAEAQGDRIRVMSVHGAKGLEAPIVILPDTAKKTVSPKNRLYAGASEVFFGPPADDLPPLLSDWRDARKEADEAEKRRLLYVAMTRAQSWLILCGAGKGEGGWHGLVTNGMAHVGAVDADFPTGGGQRYEVGDWATGALRPPASTPTAPAPLPVLGVAGPAPERSTTRAPSELGGAKVLPGDPSMGDRDAALARGTLIHLLLEHLPQQDADIRHALGLRIAAGSEADLLPGDQHALVDDVVRMIATDDLAVLFGDDTLTEVDVTGDLPGIGRLHGAIDRLIVTDDAVTAIDYKSNRLVPDAAPGVPEAILRQMGAYAALLSAIWPGRRIETAVLWTATAQLMPLPADLTTAALARAATSP